MRRYSAGYRADELKSRILTELPILRHRNIQHTVRYTELSPTRYKDFWRK